MVEKGRRSYQLGFHVTITRKHIFTHANEICTLSGPSSIDVGCRIRSSEKQRILSSHTQSSPSGLYFANGGPQALVSSPRVGCSILMTSALSVPSCELGAVHRERDSAAFRREERADGESNWMSNIPEITQDLCTVRLGGGQLRHRFPPSGTFWSIHQLIPLSCPKPEFPPTAPLCLWSRTTRTRNIDARERPGSVVSE